MRPLRVLHVIPSLALEDGGPTRAMLEMERSLADAGVEVTTVTTVETDATPPAAPAVGVHRIYVRRVAKTYKLAPSLVSLLPGLLRRHDIVHAHALFSFAPNLTALWARAAGVPYIVRPLGTLASYGLASRRPALKRLSLACIEAGLLHRAAAVHFTSSAEQEEAERLAIPMRSVVIPLGIAPPSSVVPDALDRSSPAGRTVLLFLSRLHPKKNLESLIDAVAASDIFATGATLLVAGEGEPSYVASLKARAVRAGLGDRIVWLGHLDGASKAATFAAAHLFVLPSFSENFGIAVIEALAAGLPCLLGRGVAVAEEVVREGAGLAVAPDAASIRAAVDALIEAPTKRMAMGQNARRLAAERYSSDTMARRLVELYREVGALRAIADR